MPSRYWIEIWCIQLNLTTWVSGVWGLLKIAHASCWAAASGLFIKEGKKSGPKELCRSSKTLYYPLPETLQQESQKCGGPNWCKISSIQRLWTLRCLNPRQPRLRLQNAAGTDEGHRDAEPHDEVSSGFGVFRIGWFWQKVSASATSYSSCARYTWRSPSKADSPTTSPWRSVHSRLRELL